MKLSLNKNVLFKCILECSCFNNTKDYYYKRLGWCGNFLLLFFKLYFFLIFLTIFKIPSNQTKLEGETAQFDCQTTFSENIIIRWYREIVPIGKPQTHITTTNTGSIIINEVSADDCGKYICEIHDNLRLIGRAEAYLNIECLLTKT